MNKLFVVALVSAIPVSVAAQSAVDAYSLTQSDQRGTARFMSMGGAFTALGGDLSVMGQNPAGIGIYRSSEVGATLDISLRSFESTTASAKYNNDVDKVYFDNFGYVGTVRLDGALRTFNWGVSYNRLSSFDRTYSGYNNPTAGSLTNYIANFTTESGVAPSTLDFGEGYNPYLDSNADWLSILGYTSYLISFDPHNGVYQGLYQNGTVSDALYNVRERGYVDEYNIAFGGNVSDIVFWGVDFGITDLSYHRDVYYSESMSNAQLILANGKHSASTTYHMNNYKTINGTGFNVKLGLIFKPVNEFRIGFAVHTPTWYNLTHSTQGDIAYEFDNIKGPLDTTEQPFADNEYTDVTFYDSRLTSPWKIMIGAAGVIGQNAIISFDYERQAYNDMSVKYQSYYGGYYDSSFIEDEAVNGDIKNYFRATDIFRVGAEYRVTPQFSVRAGYNYATSNVKDEAAEGRMEIFTNSTDTDPSYTFNKETQAVSFGLGYKYRGWSFDAAYIYRNRNSTFHAYTNYANDMGYVAPTADIKDATNSLVFSVSYRF